MDVVALVVAAALWIAYGVYRFRKPVIQHYLLKLILYVVGGAVLVLYEIHMFWYWFVLGILLIILAMFGKASPEAEESDAASEGSLNH